MTNNNNENKISVENSCDFHLFCNFEPKLPVLEIIHEKFIRLLRISLSNFLKTVVSVEPKKVETLFFKDFKDNIKESKQILINKLKGLNGYSLYLLDRKLGNRMIDLLFGASSKSQVKDYNEDYTPLQLSVVRKLMQVAIDDYNKAWSTVYKIDASISRSEINPQFIGIVQDDAKVLVTTAEISFAGVKGEFQFVLPYATLFPARDKIFTAF